MKILDSYQISEGDIYTEANEPIASIDLMERAANKFVSHFINDYYTTSVPKYIFCGSGNNGADGLAVARLLCDAGHHSMVFIHENKNTLCQNFITNLERLKDYKSVLIHKYSDIKFLMDFDFNNGIIIDAILGVGCNKPLSGLNLDIVAFLNTLDNLKISIDVPTGMVIDKHNNGTIFKADRVYTFQSPKLAFLLPEYGKNIKRFEILDIKIHPKYLDEIETKYFYIDKFITKSILKKREKFSHKGIYGHGLIIAGSKGKMGAAILAAKSALRSGIGLLTVHTSELGSSFIHNNVPEAMCSMDTHNDYWSILPNLSNYNALGVGPGIGSSDLTKNVLHQLLKTYEKPIVFDADAINIISNHKEFMNLIPSFSIFTPHPKEFERLVGIWNNDFERLEKQIEFSKKHNIIIVLKGAHTSISTPEGKVYFNSTGNSGMATAGSGDVLTGIIISLLAQQYSQIEAAILGVYIHGLSGNLSLKVQSKESLIATDIIENLGQAFKMIATN